MSNILRWFLSVIQSLFLRLRLLLAKRGSPKMNGLPRVKVKRERQRKAPATVTAIERFLYRERAIRLAKLYPDPEDVLKNLADVDPFCGR